MFSTDTASDKGNDVVMEEVKQDKLERKPDDDDDSSS